MTNLVVVVGLLLVANQIVMRVERLWRSSPVFLSMQTFNVVTGIAVLLIPIPGFENFMAGKYALGVIFLFRAFWNVHERRTNLWNEKQEELEAEVQRQRALLAGREES